MNTLIETEFSFIKSTWGIWLKIGCIDIPFGSTLFTNKITYPVSDLLYLSLDEKKFTAKGRIFLYNAILHNYSKIESLLKVKTILNIETIEYALCDYQDEGLYSVMVAWLNMRFHLQLCSPEITFDDKNNKYHFKIGKLIDLPPVI